MNRILPRRYIPSAPRPLVFDLFRTFDHFPTFALESWRTSDRSGNIHIAGHWHFLDPVVPGNRLGTEFP